jgi:hypothetical protein
MGRRRKEAVERRKKITISLAERKHAGQVITPYRIMEELIEAVKEHAHLRDAKIAIAWRFGKKSDADGRLWLGTAKKGSDLDRSLHGYDFVIVLNHDAWNQASFSEAQMTALLDHELSHCDVAHDTNGQVKLDELGRKVWRIRKHDLEEFEGVVKRRGLWKSDVRSFVEAADEQRKRPLLEQAERKNGKPRETTNGKYPARVILTRDVMGMNTEEGGLFEHVEREIIGLCNGEVVVRSDNGHRVLIPADAYNVIRWTNVRPPDQPDKQNGESVPTPAPQPKRQKAKAR